MFNDVVNIASSEFSHQAIIFMKMLSKIMVCSLLSIFTVRAIINPQGPTVVSDFTNCLSALVENNFKNTGLLLFGNTKNMSTSAARIRENFLSNIHRSARFSVQIVNPIDETPICVDDEGSDDIFNVVHMDVFSAVPLGDYFVLVIDSYEDFTRVASRLIRSRNWNPHAKFIILFHPNQMTDKSNIENAERIITCLFKHNVLKILVAVTNTTDIRNAIIYSWKPFEPPKYCGYFNETAKNRLRIGNACIHGVVKYKKDDLQDRIPKNMGGCVLYMLALKRQPFIGDDLEDPNIEIKLIDEVADIFNFTTHYELVDEIRGERDEEGNWGGALRGLTAKEGQLLIGGIFPDFDVHEDFECSSTYLADSYTWVVPRAEQSPPWVALIICFRHIVWYCVIVTYFICAISWKLIGHFSEDTLYHRTSNHTLLNTWVCHLGFCSYIRPVKESLRVFYVFFNLYCILFLTAYQTKLFDVLTNPTYEEQVDTIQELVVSGLTYGGSEVLHDLYKNSSDPFDYFLGEHWKDIENITQALIDVAVYRNFSLLCSRLELAHMSAIMPDLSDGLGNYKYFVFEQNMFTVPMEMVALQGFAFIRELSLSIELVKQLGANIRLRNAFADQNARKMARLQNSLATEYSDVNALSLLHLQGGFLALIMGYLGGFLALVVEIIITSELFKSKVNHWRKRLRY